MINVHNYHNQRRLIFHHTEGSTECPRDSTLYLGAEVETDSRTSGWNTDTLERNLNGYGFLPFFDPTEDGSLNRGCEFVSQPATLDWFLANRSVIEGGFKSLLDAGLRAHQTTTCGLHVHVSRSFFGNIEMFMASAGNIVTIVESNWNAISAFARRPANSYAKRNWTSIDRSMRKKLRNEGVSFDECCRSDRYMAINFCKSPTLEFRIFKGTLNSTTFFATLQFIDNLCRLAKAVPHENALDIGFMDVVKYKKWPELWSYVSTLRLDRNEETPYLDSGIEE